MTTMTDIDDVTEAADRLDAKLPHPNDTTSEIPMRRGYSFADLLSDLDRQSLLEFGRNIV